MKTTATIRHTLKASVAVLALAYSGWSTASTVLYEEIKIVETPHSKGGLRSSLKPITLEESGSYELTLTDFIFPEEFRKLAVAITDNHHLLAGLWSPGSITFNADAGDYFLGLAYQTGKEWKMGMYGMELNYLDGLSANVSAVPLPGAAGLMLLGMAGLAGMAGLRGRDAAMSA